MSESNVESERYRIIQIINRELPSGIAEDLVEKINAKHETLCTCNECWKRNLEGAGSTE